MYLKDKLFKKQLIQYALFQEYKVVAEHKNWNFPKAHTHKHVFQDILRKGATRVFSTKPNEKAHSPLKSFYQLMTNFKDFGRQVWYQYTMQPFFLSDMNLHLGFET